METVKKMILTFKIQWLGMVRRLKHSRNMPRLSLPKNTNYLRKFKTKLQKHDIRLKAQLVWFI